MLTQYSRSATRTLYTLLILLPLAVLQGCSPSSEQPFRVGTTLWPGYEPLHLAASLNYFDHDSISLIDSTSPHGSIQGLRNGDLDAIAITLDEVLLLLDQGIDLKVVLVFDFSDGGDAIMANKDLKSVKELKGRRVGLESTALGTYMLSRALNLNGLSLEDVEAVSMKVSSQPQAMSQGKVDAVVTFDPVRSQLLEAGAHELFTSRNIPREIVDVLAVRSEYLEQNPQHVRNLIKGWYQALDYLAQQPRSAASIIGKRLQQTPEEVLAGMNGIQLPDHEATVKLMAGGDGSSLVKTGGRLAKMMHDKQILSNTPDVHSLFTTRYMN